jgi:hypothetical protein
LKHQFRNFVQIAFLDAQNAENVFARPFDTLKDRLFDFTRVNFQTSRRKTEFSGQFDYLKNHFRDFVQVPFLDAQEAENEFSLIFRNFKYRFT